MIVTDEMVEAACRAFFAEYEPQGWEWRKTLYRYSSADPALAMMRAALEAALAV
jgi:hypothetical protein